MKNTIPPEPKEVRSPDGLAPAFKGACERVMGQLRAAGWLPVYGETTRTNERETWLYGFGRDYDDGRGVVTNAPDATHSWHYELFGLAADIVDAKYGFSVRQKFWDDLYAAAMAEGLTSGQDWHRSGAQNANKNKRDNPHVQWHADGMPVSPSAETLALVDDGTPEKLWEEFGAAEAS